MRFCVKMDSTVKMKPAILLFICILVGCLNADKVLTAGKDSFDEELFIKPFNSGHELFFFQFTTVWNTRNPC
jgi:hypothetical protein